MKEKVIFYSTHCPKCRVLEMKLKQKNVDFIEENSVDKMLEKGIKSAPALEVNGTVYFFADAVSYVNGL